MWQTIKQILHKNQGTCIIVEEGKPVYVITRFEDYEALLNNKPVLRFQNSSNEQELLEKINEEIVAWKVKQTEINPESNISDVSEVSETEDIKIENLPIV